MHAADIDHLVVNADNLQAHSVAHDAVCVHSVQVAVNDAYIIKLYGSYYIFYVDI